MTLDAARLLELKAWAEVEQRLRPNGERASVLAWAVDTIAAARASGGCWSPSYCGVTHPLYNPSGNKCQKCSTPSPDAGVVGELVACLRQVSDEAQTSIGATAKTQKQTLEWIASRARHALAAYASPTAEGEGVDGGDGAY